MFIHDLSFCVLETIIIQIPRGLVLRGAICPTLSSISSPCLHKVIIEIGLHALDESFSEEQLNRWITLDNVLGMPSFSQAVLELRMMRRASDEMDYEQAEHKVVELLKDYSEQGRLVLRRWQGSFGV
ncbi:hypothetical protein L218DRAFT_216396 [Marasmius fiardii PR-910]|nr:hypothetical protein L218DRAFT_216396 [Marasmius fiardii PR-910]